MSELESSMTVLTCQPPVPNQFSYNPAVNSIEQQSETVRYPASNRIVQNSGRNFEEKLSSLESISELKLLGSPEAIDTENDLAFTPYPGYIPPPPPPPTHHNVVQNSAKQVSVETNSMLDNVIDSFNRHAILSSPHQDFDNAIVSFSTPKHQSHNGSVRLCPSQIRSTSDFHACVQPIAFASSSGLSDSCEFEDGSHCRFQPASLLTHMGKFSSTAHYMTMTALSGRSLAIQPRGNFVYAFSQVINRV
ncbi:hypothetical protein DICVIV_08964 [Dictyocaulus viviparus]|uniref:Uncharacterized protein n=1 Tax=Dictyocaulus viviparus TaxID=29172 RepID=A0A0D8XMH9_DICVI|nr:hypothetical protein DICVIV_08964 [Dictyocaulus viviparus]